MTHNFLQVALGGAIGASARLQRQHHGDAAGAGFAGGHAGRQCAGLYGDGAAGLGLALRGGQHLAPFLLTGVLGGFTTFSAFALDTTVLWQRGDSGLAMGYVLASVVLSLAAVSAGLAIGREFSHEWRPDHHHRRG